MSSTAVPPPNEPKTITPSNSAFGFETISEEVQRGLDSLRSDLKTFLETKEALWLPSKEFPLELRTHLESLQLPRYPLINKPSLLLHGLDVIGEGEEREIDDILQDSQHV